jgi:hypothetical protein
MSAAICPECTQGKHDNCDGASWDDETDGPAVCPCWEVDHHPEALASGWA